MVSMGENKSETETSVIPRKRRLRRWLIGGGLFTLLIASIMLTDIYLIFLGPLETGIDIDNNYGEVILVLGGGLKKGREIGYSTEERLLLAVDLFKQKTRTLLISGGSLYRGSPAIKKITDFLAKRGVEKKYVRFEGKSQTTFDNFVFTRKMIEDMNARGVIVCTSPYHQERVQMILDYLEFDHFKIARMKKSEIFQAGSFRQRMRNWKLILREYVAIVKFKIFKK